MWVFGSREVQLFSLSSVFLHLAVVLQGSGELEVEGDWTDT